MSYSKQTFARIVRTLGLAFLVFLTFVSGIIRHDVPEKEYLALGKQKQFSCVGELGREDSAGHVVPGGSCVLVGEKYVLSAAHCFLDFDTRPDTLDTLIDGKKATLVLYVNTNPRLTDFSKLYATLGRQKVRVKRGVVHPDYLDSLTRGSCDIALLELEQPVRSVKSAKLSLTFDELHSDVTGVGYGESGRADKPESVKLEHKKIAGQSVVDSIGGLEFGNHGTRLFCEFVSPDNKAGKHAARPLEYIPGGGDSGGGLFRQTGNGWVLIGICSGEGTTGYDIQQLLKTGFYGMTMSWTRVSAFTGWIAAQME